LAIAPALRGLLFGVRPLDPVTFASAPALLVLVAATASALAARRALRIEPMTVLRSE
jgi:putative ABC transport system permease protein